MLINFGFAGVFHAGIIEIALIKGFERSEVRWFLAPIFRLIGRLETVLVVGVTVLGFIRVAYT
ncbi:MAG: hypothetical protein ACPGGK_17980 [Pikeienuella sp.]